MGKTKKRRGTTARRRELRRRRSRRPTAEANYRTNEQKSFSHHHRHVWSEREYEEVAVQGEQREVRSRCREEARVRRTWLVVPEAGISGAPRCLEQAGCDHRPHPRGL